MIPAPFDYKRASSAAEAIALVSEYGEDAKFLAGGHSLLPLMKLRLAQPAVLIDIARITDLSYINDAGSYIAIGAMTRHMDVEKSPIVNQHAPLLANAASHVGDPQVRHRGTIGGSIAHSDSASDLPATALALGRSISTCCRRSRTAIRLQCKRGIPRASGTCSRTPCTRIGAELTRFRLRTV